jgi:hypothetical protein
MDTVLLFRKRTPLTEDGLPWLRGLQEHPWTARRNTSGKGVVSAILVRALLSALEGSVLKADRSRSTNYVNAVVRSHSRPETAAECWLDWSSSRCGVPHGGETVGTFGSAVTYHLGVLAIVQALGEPERAQWWVNGTTVCQLIQKIRNLWHVPTNNRCSSRLRNMTFHLPMKTMNERIDQYHKLF